MPISFGSFEGIRWDMVCHSFGYFPVFFRGLPSQLMAVQSGLDIAEGCAGAATGTYAMMLDSKSSSNQTSGLNCDRFDVLL